MRTCKLKGCEKPDREFFQRRSKRNGKLYYSSYCKECEREKARTFKKSRYHDPVTRPNVLALSDARIKTPEYRDSLNRKLRDKYADDGQYRQSILDARMEARADPVKHIVIRKRAARYYQKNKRKIYEQHNQKVANSPWLKLRGFMRGRINEAMKVHGQSKGGVPSLEHLDYSWSELYAYLESRFEDWMSWSNYGEYSPIKKTWQVDHIIPQSYFPYNSMNSESFRMCWDLRNLRPLDSEQNLRDGNRKDLMGEVGTVQELFTKVRDSSRVIVVREPPDAIFSRSSCVSMGGNHVLPMSMLGLSYLDSIFIKRFSSSTAGFDSFMKALEDDWTLMKIVIHLIERGEPIIPTVVLENLRYVVRTPGHFFPMAARSVMNRYAVGGRVFDPFLGWGGRCLGALCSNVSEYVGCDLQPEVVDGCQRMAQDFESMSSVRSGFHNEDCLSFMGNDSSLYQLIFTSPPYMDTEDYGVESDSMRQNWLDEFVFPFARECLHHLSEGGKVALHLKDLKGAPTFTAYHAAMKAVGLEQIARYKYGRTWTQAVYVYALPNV